MLGKIDIYINKFEKKEREQMSELRYFVHQILETEEYISYGMPSFKYKGSILLCFAMYKNHLGYYPYSGNITKNFKSELKNYKNSSGAVQFPKDKEFPKKLIKELIWARAEEIIENTKYYYKCPDKLGYLEIKLDIKDKVAKCIFVQKKGIKPNKLPENIKKALDSYFFKNKNLGKNLISKNISGTELQKNVWAEIQKIHFGKNSTYKEIAKNIKNEKAVRAVGTACGKNPVALFIPCHRVIRKTGEDYGYAWGEKRKKLLLDFEKGILK